MGAATSRLNGAGVELVQSERAPASDVLLVPLADDAAVSRCPTLGQYGLSRPARFLSQ